MKSYNWTFVYCNTLKPQSGVIGMNERDLRKLLEKIEIKYLHSHKNWKLDDDFGSHSSPPITFKLSASLK